MTAAPAAAPDLGPPWPTASLCAPRFPKGLPKALASHSPWRNAAQAPSAALIPSCRSPRPSSATRGRSEPVAPLGWAEPALGVDGVLWPSGPKAPLGLQLGVSSAPPRHCCLEGVGGPAGHVGGHPLPRSEQHEAAGAAGIHGPSPGLQGNLQSWVCRVQPVTGLYP